jgi:Protein of unknown function (DUF4238)
MYFIELEVNRFIGLRRLVSVRPALTISTISMKHKRQHIVPNCYLSAWLEPVTPPGQQRALWKFAKDGTDKHRRSPQKTFTESDRYTVLLKNGERDLTVEHTLNRIENDFSGVLRRLRRREPITIRDKARLAIFTAAMLGRTKRRANNWKETWQDLRRMVSDFETKDDKNEASGTLSPGERLPPGAVPVNAAELDQFLLNSHPEYLTNTIEIAAPQLFAMDLSIYSTEDELGFLTSDEPCIMHNPTAYRFHPMMRSAGLRQRHVQVLLPLTPRLLIAFTHKQTYPYITPLSKDQLDEVNRMIVWYADREIVSWRGILRPEWFCTPDQKPSDAWENRPQKEPLDGVGGFEPLEGPELLDNDESILP